MDRSRSVGVLGGMGPEATVDFAARVVAMTPAKTDQDHVRMIVDNDPSIPSRQEAILRGGADPGPAMAAMATRLQAAGADFLVMPCNTAHAFSKSVSGAVSIPLLSIVDVTVAACRQYSVLGLLATEGCLRSGIYQDAVNALGQELLIPAADELADFEATVARLEDRSEENSLVQSIEHCKDRLVELAAQLETQLDPTRLPPFWLP